MGNIGAYLSFLWMLFLFNEAAVSSQEGRIPFQWITCGNSSDPIKIQSLKVYQNDSNEIFVSGKGKVAYNLESPISGKIEMMKKVGFWIPVPCIDNFGSCTYSDICSLSPYNSDCPKIYADNNLPCHCPILGGPYSFQLLPVDINFLPQWIEKGLYSIRITLTSGGERLLCLKMIVDI